MKRKIFYSWQSDLPNNTNRGFIGDCLKKAINGINKKFPYEIDFNIDRDTKDEIGTPDIVNTIFNKIEQCSIFVADISIINPGSTTRKTPNPNVLIELGYAAKILGWEKIMCVYNTDYGKLEDLPFDLKFRRPISYSLNNNKKGDIKLNLTNTLEYAILEISKSNNLYDELFDFVKVKVDTKILSLSSILIKIVFGYNRDKTLNSNSKLLNIKKLDLIELLKTNEYLGFQIFKNLDNTMKNFESLLENSLLVKTLSNPQLAPLVKIFRWIIRYENIQSWRHVPDIYIPLNKTSIEYLAPNGKEINPSNPENGYLLLKKLDKTHSQVEDFGDFREKEKVKNLLNFYKINENHIELYADTIMEYIEIVTEWLDNTGYEFIIDNKYLKIMARK